MDSMKIRRRFDVVIGEKTLHEKQFKEAQVVGHAQANISLMLCRLLLGSIFHCSVSSGLRMYLARAGGRVRMFGFGDLWCARCFFLA